MKNISLNQLAGKAGVSKTTASLILNGKSDRYKISQSTKERVLKLAKDMGYKPNVLARNLSMGKSMTAGLIVPDLRKYENAVLAEHIEKKLLSYGYHTVLGITGGDDLLTEKLIAEMKERKVDGIVLLGPFEAKETDIPAVRIGNGDDNISSITTDSKNGVKKLIGYWYTRGKRTIGYVGLKKGNNDLKKGFSENYIERFSMQGEHIFLIDHENNEKKLGKILKTMAHKGFNAIMFESPELVFTALNIRKKVEIPEFDKISFGSFGYSPAFEIVSKEIVYLTKPLEKIAEESISVLTAMMHNGTKGMHSKKIEPLFLF